MGHTKHAVMVGLYVTSYRKSVLEGGRNCTHAGCLKNEFAPMQVLMEKNPAPVQNFHVFGSSYVKSYTGVLPKELGWVG